MAREDSTLLGSGVLGNSIAANTLLAAIAAPGPGRYRISGVVRHTLVDGVKLTSPSAFVIPSAPNVATNFGPFIIDITNSSTGIGVSLNTATGASDTASAVLYAERINQ